MDTKESILKKYNISDELFESAEISWEDLVEIYDDFSENKYGKYEAIMNDFLDTYFKENLRKKRMEEGKQVKIHSIRSRVKDAEHLIVKIIRKKQEKRIKYRDLDKKNYEKFLTDLIGIRCLVLFKEDWEDLHYYILSQFENDVKYYVKDSIRDFDEDETHYYLAEEPKVHIRTGDAREAYEKVFSPDCVLDDKVYRSIHYIIKYKGVYLEIQVRTVFEEGWGEVDHAIIYPYYEEDVILKEYTELLNRLTGLADEMSSFFNRLKCLEVQHIAESPPIRGQDTETLKARTENLAAPAKKEEKIKVQQEGTPNACLETVLDE